jgi:hypothetical protein
MRVTTTITLHDGESGIDGQYADWHTSTVYTEPHEAIAALMDLQFADGSVARIPPKGSEAIHSELLGAAVACLQSDGDILDVRRLRAAVEAAEEVETAQRLAEGRSIMAALQDEEDAAELR